MRSIAFAVVALGIIAATPVLACTQETADRLAATDTQQRRDADLVSQANIIGVAVLTGVEGDLYAFAFEQALRGSPPEAFSSESMVRISCRYGDQSWRLERLRVGDRVLVLGGQTADGGFRPDYVFPAGSRAARRLQGLIQRNASAS